MKQYNKKITELIKDSGIDESKIGERVNFLGAKETAIDIMIKCGMPKKIALAAMYGIQNGKADVSIYLMDIWNFCEMYDGLAIAYCLDLAEKFMSGDQKCEVGMKYPNFNKRLLISKYNIEMTGTFEPHWSKDRKEKDKYYYELWQDEKRTVSFSFEKGRMGEGGYMGATFENFDMAISFAEWFLQSSSNYVKDIDLFVNKLGGLSIDEIEEINN